MLTKIHRPATSRWPLRFSAACVLVPAATLSVMLPLQTTAQSPSPSQHLQNAPPGAPGVPSGAGGVVVEGLGAGLGGC